MTARLILSAILLATVATPPAAQAADAIKIMLKDNRFSPAEITVPAGERFRIELTNHGTAAAELESKDLKIEKIVAAGSTITVSGGPLKPGTYLFVDEYHEDEARGTITAVAK